MRDAKESEKLGFKINAVLSRIRLSCRFEMSRLTQLII